MCNCNPLLGGDNPLGLIVNFYDGTTSRIAVNSAVWLPQPLHERIVFELQLPVSVRRHFLQTGPFVYPGFDENFENAVPEYYLPYWTPVAADRVGLKPEAVASAESDWMTSELRERVAKQLSDHNARLTHR